MFSFFFKTNSQKKQKKSKKNKTMRALTSASEICRQLLQFYSGYNNFGNESKTNLQIRTACLIQQDHTVYMLSGVEVMDCEEDMRILYHLRRFSLDEAKIFAKALCHLFSLVVKFYGHRNFGDVFVLLVMSRFRIRTTLSQMQVVVFVSPELSRAGETDITPEIVTTASIQALFESDFPPNIYRRVFVLRPFWVFLRSKSVQKLPFEMKHLIFSFL